MVPNSSDGSAESATGDLLGLVAYAFHSHCLQQCGQMEVCSRLTLSCHTISLFPSNKCTNAYLSVFASDSQQLCYI